MAKIIGNTTATPNPRPDWNQTDETKADYIKNKPDITGEINSHNIDADAHADIRQALDLLTNGASAEEIDGVKDLISYVNKHGSEVTQMQADIKANKNNISKITFCYYIIIGLNIKHYV